MIQVVFRKPEYDPTSRPARRLYTIVYGDGPDEYVNDPTSPADWDEHHILDISSEMQK